MRAVIFHSNDPQVVRSAEGGAEHKQADRVDTKTFLDAISVLRDIKEVANQLHSEAHVAIKDKDAILLVSDIDANKRHLAEFLVLLEEQRRLLKV